MADLNQPIDISIPLTDGVSNPNCYHTEHPTFRFIAQGDFIGSVEAGGPCNHAELCLRPHGNGTHTECYGHLSPDPRATLNRCMTRFHFMAELVTMQPETINGDQILTWKSLKDSMLDFNAEALIIRTSPNAEDKLTRQYTGTNPPYIERELAQKFRELNVKHLLVDLPSLDKEEDQGRMEAHHAFWNYPENTRKDCTITELVYVPDTVSDGQYLLNLQITSLESDASPSKPVLYSVLSI